MEKGKKAFDEGGFTNQGDELDYGDFVLHFDRHALVGQGSLSSGVVHWELEVPRTRWNTQKI